MTKPTKDQSEKYVQMLLDLGSVTPLRCMRCGQPATLSADPVLFGDPPNASRLTLCEDCTADVAWARLHGIMPQDENPA